MNFKVENLRRKGREYQCHVTGKGDFSLENLTPYMLEISKKSTHYKLWNDSHYYIYDKRNRDNTRAEISLESTIARNIKVLRVSDRGRHEVGKQMVEKFMNSIANPEIVKIVESNQTTPK